MPRIRSIPFCLALLAAFALRAPAAEQTPWLELHSAHFTVITDAGDKKGREVAFRFEQMRAVFASLLARDRLNQPVPLTILALKSDDSYYRIAPLVHTADNPQAQPIDAPGFFLHGDDQDFIVLNLFEDDSWRAVAHDFAHMLLNANYPPAQAWFDEGLAEYFSSIRPDNKQIEIGGDPELRPSVKADQPGNPRAQQPEKSLIELLQSQTWLSIPDLFAMKHDTTTFNEDTHQTIFYAESWMVMHYLLHENKLPETGTYLGLVLNQHVPIEDAIQQAYGMSAAKFEQAVKDYFHAQAPLITALDQPQGPSANAAANPPEHAYRFPSPMGPDDSAIIANPLPEADARAVYAEVATRVPERREFGLQELQKLATAPTPADMKAEAKAAAAANKSAEQDNPNALLPTNAIGNAMAHRILAWDHIVHGEFDDALTELGQTAALNPRDMWARYYLCVLKYRMAQARHAEIQGLPNMLIDLRTVLEWYPEMASAYDLTAMARNEGGTTAAAMQSERAAMMLAPRDQMFAYHMALIYISDKQWAAAQAQLDRVKAGGDPQAAALARQQLDQLASEKKYGLPGVTGPPQAKLEPQKSPFDILDQDAAKRAADEKATQAGGDDVRPTKFFRGRLVDVDCSQSPAAVLTIESGAAEKKFRAADYKSLLLIGADSFHCDWHNVEVSANYKPGGSTDGDLVSLEVR
jgi:hypothetical protein